MTLPKKPKADCKFCEYRNWVIVKYNNSRGVERTSIHAFRHTFARKYLVDCGGDAFSLQRLMDHSTLKMTLNL